MSFYRALAELSLTALTLCLQSAGVAALIAWVRLVVRDEMHAFGAIRLAALFVRLAMAVVVLHGLEILLWASFYRWRCLSSWNSAMYLSASNYSTLGCSDVSLPACWRTLAPLESVIGSLMCGLSVSLLFAIVTRLVNRKERSAPKRQDPRVTHRSFVERNIVSRKPHTSDTGTGN